MPTKKAASRPAFSWDDLSQEQIVAVLDMFGDDGHGILDADKLRADSDIPVTVIDTFETVEKSDGSYKGSIFSPQTGERLPELRGIYCLTVTRSLARHYGVTSAAFGRGTEARQLTAGIRAKLTPAVAAD